jgi:hypothetical protein
VRAFTALRVVAGVGGARRRVGLEPPFVGRDREFGLVVECRERDVQVTPHRQGGTRRHRHPDQRHQCHGGDDQAGGQRPGEQVHALASTGFST